MRESILLIYVVAMLLGVLTGMVGSFFQLGIYFLNKEIHLFMLYSTQHAYPTALVSALVSAVLLATAWLLVKKIAPEAAGSGVQEIEGVLLHERPIYWRRLIPVKFFGGILALSAKLVSGREGPTIQMGGNLGDMLGELFACSPARRDALIAAGAAAGLAAAFNAPLAGVLFIMEEMRNAFNYSFTHFKMVALACMMATITLDVILGTAPAIPMHVFELPDLPSLWFFLLLGVIMGFIGLSFNKSLMGSLRLTDKLSLKKRFAYVIIVGLLIGYLAVLHPLIVGGGYDIIQQALTVVPPLSTLVGLLIIRFVLTIICYNTGVPGGIFAPMLALGVLAGVATAAFLQLITHDHAIHPGMFAVAGMGGLFAASIRAPMTGIVLVVEMTQNYQLILPMMVTCLTSTTIVQLAGNAPIYTQLLQRTLNKAGEVK